MQEDHYHQFVNKKKKQDYILYTITITLVATLAVAIIATW